MSMLKSLARPILKRIRPVSSKNKVDLNSVPAQYRPLVKKIMANSPIWGSHQTITFPDGFVLEGGRDQSRIEQFDLPADLSGCSVLDIGCNIGGIALECKLRNAERVMAVDLRPNLLECAEDIAKIWDVDVEFRQLDISSDHIEEKFDYVFFLNVFHHLSEKGKIKALRTLDAITKRRLYFEAPISDDVIAGEDKWLRTEDYVDYFKGFTNFRSVEVSGYTDFGRPLLTCDQ